MASEAIYKLLDLLSNRIGEGANTTSMRRLEALQELALRCNANDVDVLDRLEVVVSTADDTIVRVTAVKTIASIFNRDPQSNRQNLATRLIKFITNEREEVCEQTANALAELGPDGKQAVDTLWARLGDDSCLPSVSSSIARAILKIEALEENAMLDSAFTRLSSSDPQNRSAGIAFLKTNVGWHLLMSSEEKSKYVQNLLGAYRAISSRALLSNIISLIVDLTPDYSRLFKHLLPNIEIPPAIFEAGKVLDSTHTVPPSDPYFVRWKQAIFLVDPRVRNFINENILKRRVRLELKEDTKWFEEASVSNPKKDPLLRKDSRIKIIDRSPHSNWFKIETSGGTNGWMEATTELNSIVFNLIDESPLDGSTTAAIMSCRYRILSLMLGELQDSDQNVRQNMIAWLRECDQYFTPKERMLVSNALWECILQHGQGLHAYATIDLRNEDDAILEAVEELIYSNIDKKVIGVVGGLFLKEGSRELDALYERPGTQQDYPHKFRILPFILGALESPEEQVRQLALVWVYRRASGGKAQDTIPGPFMRDLLTRVRRLADESSSPNVGKLARNSLIPITEKHSKFLFAQFDKKGALAIDIINELVEMKSPAVMISLIRQWGYWIAETDKSQLVEATALELRTNKTAILPLIERLRDPLRFEDDEEVALKVKTLNQAVPVYADQILDDFLLDREEKKWLQEKSKKEEEMKGTSSSRSPQPKLEEWIESLVDRGGKYSELDQVAKDSKWDERKRKKEFVELFWKLELERRELLVRRRVALQLAEMSSPRFFENEEYEEGTDNPKYIGIKSELRTHAVPYLAHKLPGEPDLRVREHLARTLANVGELEAVDALALAIVAEDRTKAIRQEVLADYYLEPSMRRSEQAATILSQAVDEAKHTMRLIQILSVATFVLGVVIVAAGLYLATNGDPGTADKLFGLFASIGGIAGIITLLIKGPLNDIQNSIANLVQLETAFTNFIWELNLNSTYIQSQYVEEGVIANDVAAATIDRMESAMNTAMNVIALYTEEGRQRVFAHINAVLPGSGAPGTEIKVMGQYLKLDDGKKRDPKGKILVAINHKRTDAEITLWEKDQVKFKLKKEDLPALDKGPGTIWISLLVDGLETNAVPFELIEKVSETAVATSSEVQTNAEPSGAAA